MGRFRMRYLAVLLGVLAGSQLGHSLVYVVRYGVDAWRYESVGVHAYYPTLTASLSAVLGVGLMSGLLLLAAARTTGLAAAGWRPRSTVRYLDVLAAVFVAQLVVFVCQESIEALAAGHTFPSIGDQLLWGALGQLPAAAVAAAMIAWLLARLDAAWTVLAEGAPRLIVEPSPSVLDRAPWSEADGRLRLGSAFPSAFRKRGPPRLRALT